MSSPGSFQFYVTIDGFALETRGLVEEYNSQGIITQIGLVTSGFVVGEGDFWVLSDSAVDPGWVESDA